MPQRPLLKFTGLQQSKTVDDPALLLPVAYIASPVLRKIVMSIFTLLLSCSLLLKLVPVLFEFHSKNLA